MAILDTIGDILIADGVVDGSSGWTLCKSYMPENVDNATDQQVGIFETGGNFPDPELSYPEIQIIARGQAFEYDLVRTKIDDIITSIDNVILAGLLYNYLANSPVSLGLDTNNRPSITINFSCAAPR